MARHVLTILVFAIVMPNNVNGIIGSSEKIENDSSQSAKGHEVEKCERTSHVFNFTPRGKRNAVPRKRKMPEQLELLKIPDREWLRVQVKKRLKLRKEESTAAALCIRRNKEKDHRRCIPCSICDVSFWYDKDYVNHCAEKHGNLEPYRCDHCERKYKWKRNLKQHLDEKHDAKPNPFSRWRKKKCREITCEICGETSPNLLAFEHHALSQHENEKMMACAYCPKKYYRRCTLLTHVRSNHDDGDDEESEAEYKLLHEHISQPQDCMTESERCERKHFKQERNGNLKVKTENRDDRRINLKYNASGIYTCPHCNLDIFGKVEYENHGKSTHKSLPLYRCEECQKGFSRERTMKVHYKEKHESDKIRCSSCSKCYSNLGALRKHEYACKRKARNEALHEEQGIPSYTCHNDSPYHERTIVIGKSHNAGIYRCPHCNMEIFGLVKYEKHCESMHKGLSLYQCEKCQKGFHHRNTFLSHHKEKHDNDKIRCSSCSKCYSNAGDLRKHEYVCGKRTRNEALRKEQGLPFYTCDICKKEYHTKWKSFQKHVNGHEKYVFCHICKQGFNKYTNSQALAEHIRVRHPLLENIDALLKMAAKVNVKCENVDEEKKMKIPTIHDPKFEPLKFNLENDE